MGKVTTKTFYEANYDTLTADRIEAEHKRSYWHYKESDAYEDLLSSARGHQVFLKDRIARCKTAIQEAKKDIKKWAAKERELQFMVDRLKLLEQQYEKPKRRKKNEQKEA